MKKITSLSLGLSFLIMSYTGIMLFICPHGRVAYWSDWHLLGLSKTQYGELHTTSMVSFLFFGIWHIYYNWKAIMSYMKNKAKKVSFTRKEFLIALGLNLIFIVGTLVSVPPFKSFLHMGESIKDGWTKQYGEPPYGHAEETKLNVFCKKQNINLEEAKAKLTAQRIVFKDNEMLKTIAENNNMAPSEVYQIIKIQSVRKGGIEFPSNLGRKTLQDLSNLKKINVDKAITLLKRKGLSDITSDSRMKNIADELEVLPTDVYIMLKEEK